MMDQTLISLDIETTGLSPENDEIIEIAAIRFSGEQTLDVFHTLVNPHRSLPYRVRMLTGITQDEADSAPSLSQVSNELTSFIASHPVIGHNIAFDLSFLAAKGIKLPNHTYDTFELASLLFPQLEDYSLSSVANHLQLSFPHYHRALADTTAAKEIFLSLLDKLRHLDPALVNEIARLTAIGGWSLHSLFRNIVEGKAKLHPSSGTGTGQEPSSRPSFLPQSLAQSYEKPLRTDGSKNLLEVETLVSILCPGGSLEKVFPAFEYRPGQVSMMQAVAEAINNDQHLIVEAGTGTGKSIAYLLPAVSFALANNAPMVISTNTINLQEQLIDKDIPDLLRVANVSTSDLRVVALKGRTNYLCPRRWNSLRSSLTFSQTESGLLIRTLIWLTSTTSGDRAEFHFLKDEVPLWNRICAHEDDCLGEKCDYQRNNRCFLYHARRRAQSAHIIVTNHALLLSDLIAGNQILPPFSHLIIDEAHHLESEATEQFSLQITPKDLTDCLDQYQPRTGSGFIANLKSRLKGSNLAPQRQRDMEQVISRLQRHVEAATVWTSLFFSELVSLLQAKAEGGNEYERTLRLTPKLRGIPAWSDLEWSWQNLDSALKDIEGDLNRLHIALEGLEAKISGREDLLHQLSSLLHTNLRLQQQINSIISSPQPNTIYWGRLSSVPKVKGDGVPPSASLHSAPVQVGTMLDRLLFSHKDCVILTSATLSIGNDFQYIKDRLGLLFANELIVETPFDYQASTLLYIPQDIPEPGKPGYQQGVEQALITLCRATQGQTLALFTSHAALRATYAAIQHSLEEDGILALGQGIDGNPKQLLSALKSNPKTVLLGTSSLWEGIDVMGEALSALAILRLPFSVPTDPIFAARSELFDDDFQQYALPQAVLRFKQGFGRLIRSRTDRGVVVVLDRRIQTKYYGATFLKSLPRCTVKSGSTSALGQGVTTWLGKT